MKLNEKKVELKLIALLLTPVNDNTSLFYRIQQLQFGRGYSIIWG